MIYLYIENSTKELEAFGSIVELCKQKKCHRGRLYENFSREKNLTYTTKLYTVLRINNTPISHTIWIKIKKPFELSDFYTSAKQVKAPVNIKGKGEGVVFENDNYKILKLNIKRSPHENRRQSKKE